MKDLAKEYAALVPAWAEGKPGVACRDPESGDRFRLTDADGWIAEHRFNDLGQLTAAHDHLRHDWLDACARAIAAGPDLDDACTLNGLLGPQGQVSLRAGWWVANVGGFCAQDQNRAEAIINACIAQAKGKK